MKTGDKVSFNHSFPDGFKECIGVVSHLHGETGAVIVLESSHKDKKEVLALSDMSDFSVLESNVDIPVIERKSKHSVSDRILFNHKFSSDYLARKGVISYVYNDGEGYFVETDDNNEIFFLSHNMVIEKI